MSNVWFTSDLHEGHKNIGKYRKIPGWAVIQAQENPVEGLNESTLANTMWIDFWWRRLITNKRDFVQCLGDNAFTEWGVDQIADRPGCKHMKGGNHDDLPIDSYLRAFETVRGCEKKYGFWIGHIPAHPDELRGSFCVHGHTHYYEIDDYRYINVCCDNLMEKIGRPFITLEEIRTVIAKRKLSKKVEWL